MSTKARVAAPVMIVATAAATVAIALAAPATAAPYGGGGRGGGIHNDPGPTPALAMKRVSPFERLERAIVRFFDPDPVLTRAQ
jgi:hypothetical protein